MQILSKVTYLNDNVPHDVLVELGRGRGANRERGLVGNRAELGNRLGLGNLPRFFGSGIPFSFPNSSTVWAKVYNRKADGERFCLVFHIFLGEEVFMHFSDR